jgi:transposase-like protein
MSKRYTAEFKRDAIALVRSSPHRNVTEIARELGVSPEGLRGWVKQAKVDRSAVQLLKKRAKKEARHATHVNHKVAKTVVAVAGGTSHAEGYGGAPAAVLPWKNSGASAHGSRFPATSEHD